jgi:hypothetical protein
MRTTIDSYKSRAGRLDTAGIDFEAFRDHPLSPETLRCLRYMHDVEFHTVCYLRDLLLTPAHRDPEITAFLSCWVFEELWHGEALGQVLDAHDEPSGVTRIAPLRQQRRHRDLLGVLAHAGVSSLFGEAFIAVHMSWGAVNEWTTQAGYARLAAVSEHPVLSELLRRIMKQEGRHIDFYASEATRRLSLSTKSQKLTRFALKHLWSPVGSGVMPDAEVAFLVDYLLGGAGGLEVAERIDRRIDALPGLAGLHLLGGAVDKFSAPQKKKNHKPQRAQLATSSAA